MERQSDGAQDDNSLPFTHAHTCAHTQTITEIKNGSAKERAAEGGRGCAIPDPDCRINDE